MNAAIKLFIADGFARTNVSSISREAGVTKKAIYDLVGDKDAVFRAVCTRICEKGGNFSFDKAMNAVTVKDILTDMASILIKGALDGETIAFARTVAMACTDFPDLIDQLMKDGMKVINGLIADVFSQLIRQGRIAPVEPSEAADAFYDVVVGNRSQRAILGYAEPLPTAAQQERRINMFLTGYLTVAVEHT